MQIVRFIVQLNLTEPLRPWLDLRAVIRAAAGSEGPEIQAPPAILDSDEHRRRVTLQVRSIEIRDEGEGTLGEVIKRCVKLFGDINSKSPIGSVGNVTTEVSFIAPVGLPFHEAVLSIKTGFLGRSELIDRSTDVGVSLDFDEGETFRHIEVGPMELSQLTKEVVLWPANDLPPVFVFVNLRQRNQFGDFNTKRLEDLLTSAGVWQSRMAEDVLRTLQIS